MLVRNKVNETNIFLMFYILLLVSLCILLLLREKECEVGWSSVQVNNGVLLKRLKG